MKHTTSFIDCILNILLVTAMMLVRANFDPNQASKQQQAQDAENSGLTGEQEISVVVFEDGIVSNGIRSARPADVIAQLPPNQGKRLILSVTGGNQTVTDRTVGSVARELWHLRPPGVEVTRY